MAIIVGANVGRGVSRAVAKRNIVRVRRAFGADPLVLWHEIDEDDGPDEHRLLRAVFRTSHYEHAAFDSKDPISVPREGFRLARWSERKIMDGVAPAKPGPASPHRFITKAIVVPDGLDDEVAVLGTHFPNFEPRDPRWRDCLDALVAEIDAEHDAGRTVLWEGDLNANRAANLPRRLHRKERRIHAAGNDFMGVVPAATRVEVHGRGRVNLTIDGHDALWARLSFRDDAGRRSA